MSLPPGTNEAPALQTLRWLIRPIAFMENARRRFGDAFSINLLGFQTPLVMVSHPDAVRALYTERAHGLPPGRSLSLRPIVGDRSVLLLEGAEHLSRRKLMLPPFHGDRMRAYEPIMREAAAREIESWPESRPFAVHPSMQAITLEVIMRAVFGVADRERLADHLRELLRLTASPNLQFVVLRVAPLQRPGPAGEARHARPPTSTRSCSPRSPSAAPIPTPRSARTSARCWSARASRTASAMERPRDPRPADDAAGRRPRDDGDRRSRGRSTCSRTTRRRSRGCNGEVDAGEETYLRAVIAESLRLRPVVPLAGRRLASDLRVDGLDLPAGTDVTPAIWLTHTRADLYPEPYAFRPERFLNGAPKTYAWIPFGGGIRRCLGAAFAEMEMRVVLAEILRRRALRPASRNAERVARRNVTFSPRHGTRLIAAPRT